ncbi:glycosyltransferase family 2 protein [Lophiostoma macrostomum CBS 122681]|uniref:Glycosyltransferase family 2 protein n=1 Tax=Lophiostoma macrostomum CBS 122681 TaxID=1314788 RepID=A0A6A6TCW0_9PLEO|nr:glycosyltransferase family 2 protein [Lophiostoma macrostomum CBS 122681]
MLGHSEEPIRLRVPSGSISAVRSKIRFVSARSSAIVWEWTPFILVSSYFVFSTCIYMVCSEKMIEVFWYVYMLTNTYVSMVTVLEAVLSIAATRESRNRVNKVAGNDFKSGSGPWPTPDDQLPILDLIIVAYLPNERDIIMDRVEYLCTKIVYPVDRIRVNCLYNTPVDIEPLESELAGLMDTYEQLRVIKVPNSKSKADNLNYFFTLDTGADIIAIFDADHYPHPHNPRWAAEGFMADSEVGIVQGRCIIYNSRDSWLTRLIAIEFDKIYAVSHPGRAIMMDFGLFCGSNGYWRAELLKSHKMHGEMLTEDIDSALRAVQKNVKAIHEINAVSYELAPSEFQGFWKQRLRWAQGWAQASLVHMPMVWGQPEEGTRSFTKRFGIFSLLAVRETSYYLITQYTCLVLSFIILDFPKTPLALARMIFFPYPLSVWFFVISVACLMGTLVITWRVRSEFISAGMMVIFSIFYPFYLVVMGMIGLYGHARQVVAYSNWNPTART